MANTPQTEAHLDSCPCCGGEASFYTRGYYRGIIAFAQCETCGLQTKVFQTELAADDEGFLSSPVAQKIASLWNRRVSKTQ